jgi:hypothetical protein
MDESLSDYQNTNDPELNFQSHKYKIPYTQHGIDETEKEMALANNMLKEVTKKLMT